MDNENNSYGAYIERGLVTKAVEDGYIVESYDRKGLTTPPIQSIHQDQFNAGSRVYFFLFDDGSGKIIAPIDD